MSILCYVGQAYDTLPSLRVYRLLDGYCRMEWEELLAGMDCQQDIFLSVLLDNSVHNCTERCCVQAPYQAGRYGGHTHVRAMVYVD